MLLKRTTAAFNKHVIRRKTAGRGITDGGVPGISEEGTTLTDGSLFQHLVMHIAQNFIPVPNNQRKQYRCFQEASLQTPSEQSGSPGAFDAAQTREDCTIACVQIYPRATELLLSFPPPAPTRCVKMAERVTD